jgi:hypothetical protein
MGFEFTETKEFHRLGNRVFWPLRTKCSGLRSPIANLRWRSWSRLNFLSAGMKFFACNGPDRPKIMTYGDAKFPILGRFETQNKTISTLKLEKLSAPRENLVLQSLESEFSRILVKLAPSNFLCERRCLGRFCALLDCWNSMRCTEVVDLVRLALYELAFDLK